MKFLRKKASLIFTILLSIVMFGVLFGVMTNSRNSILIKEVIFVVGGSLAAFLAGILIINGVPFYKERVSKLSVFAFILILVLMLLRHFFGISSVNGPFTIFANLSLAVLLLSALFYMKVSHIRVFVSLLLGSSLIIFIYAILQWQGVNIFAWDASLTRSGRSTGSMGNPNLLGGFASALIPLSIAYFVSLKRFSKTVRYMLSAVFIGLITFAVIASGTRGSILGVFSGTLFYLLWYLKKSKVSIKKIIPLVVGFIFVTLIVILPMRSRLAELNSSTEGQGTLQVRKVIWSGAYELFTKSPIWGHGPGSFQILFPEVRNPSYNLLGVSHNTLHAHCEYLEILVDIGLIGLILWATLFYGLISKLKHASMFQMAAFSGVIAMLVEALVSVHLRWPPTAWLFATLLLVSFIRKGDSVIPDSKMKSSAVLFLLTGFVLVAGIIFYYLPLLHSSQLVFKGKDIYLAKTEMAMNSAYSAASQWNNTHDENSLNNALNAWYGAGIYADSAVYYSQEAVNVFPKDLGSWYALGSAHLTRYMVMSPPVPAMQNVLNYAGVSIYTQTELINELNEGMSAYDSLLTLAPNYAEVHNNLALGFSNQGNISESMRELYKAYLLHGHRRADYQNQVSALLTIYPNSVDGALLYFTHTLLYSLFYLENSEVDEIRIAKHQKSIIYQAWSLISSQPENSDTLKVEFVNLVIEYVPEEYQVSLIDQIETIEQYSLFEFWESGDIFSMDPEEALNQIAYVSRFVVMQGSTFSSILPDNRDFYVYPFLVLLESDWNETIYNMVLDIFLAQIRIDRSLDDAYTLIYSDRFQSVVDPSIVEKIHSVRSALGGSRTALREEIPMPWLEGSLPALISENLHLKMEEDSLNIKWYEMELELDFLLITSYWWDYTLFTQEQNYYLLERIFYCRDMIRTINPENWQRSVALILEKEINRIAIVTNSQCPPTIGLLRDDLVNGTARNMI